MAESRESYPRRTLRQRPRGVLCERTQDWDAGCPAMLWRFGSSPGELLGKVRHVVSKGVQHLAPRHGPPGSLADKGVDDRRGLGRRRLPQRGGEGVEVDSIQREVGSIEFVAETPVVGGGERRFPLDRCADDVEQAMIGTSTSASSAAIGPGISRRDQAPQPGGSCRRGRRGDVGRRALGRRARRPGRGGGGCRPCERGASRHRSS